MAQNTLDPEALSCSICLNVLKDPVTLPSGHCSYCSGCVHSLWDTEDTEQCMEMFSTRPVSGKSYTSLVGKNFCSQHNKLTKMFCRSDQQLICYLCCTDQHKGHDTVTSAAEIAQRHAQLQVRRAQLLQIVQDKETDLESLRQEAQDITTSAQTAEQRSRDSLTQIILLLEERRSEVERHIRSQQETRLSQVHERQDQLQQDITELSKTISELDALSLTPDHNQFLQLHPSLSTATQRPDSARTQTGPRRDFEEVTRVVSALSQKLQLALSKFILPGPEPTSREDFLKYLREITLDPNTAGTKLSLSDGNRRATVMSEKQSYPDHPDRFRVWGQVLSTEGLKSGRCYWEVERSGVICVAAAYKDTERHCGFGHNDKSWALVCEDTEYSFWFNRARFHVSGPVSSRIGVYLDHSAGALSFFSIQDQTMTLLHRVQTSFTQPLHPGLRVWFGATALFPKLK